MNITDFYEARRQNFYEFFLSRFENYQHNI